MMTSDNQVSYKSSKEAHKNRCTYSCGNCGVNFLTELSLMLHIANAHPDNLSSLRVIREVTTIFRCRLCDDEFTYLSDFTSHMSVHGPRNKTTIPIIAERIQVTKQKVTSSASKARNVKLFSTRQTPSTSSIPVHTRCFSCGKKYTESSGFTTLDSVNFCILPTPECTTCNLVFSTSKELKEHNKIHTHPSEPDSTEMDDTDKQTAPVKLLKIEENANQQFKLYTCSACNHKFSINMTKAKKMLIPCANIDSPIAFGVPLNGPDTDTGPSKLMEHGMSFRQQESFVISELKTEPTKQETFGCKTTGIPNVLVGLLKKNKLQSRKSPQESSCSENVMSGVLADGSEFVIMKTNQSELVVKSGNIKIMAKNVSTSGKKKTDGGRDMSNTDDSDEGLSHKPIKPDPDPEYIPVTSCDTGLNGNELEKNQVKDIQLSVKKEVVDGNNQESNPLSHNIPHKIIMTRSMKRKLNNSRIPPVPVIEQPVPNHENTVVDDECLKNKIKIEPDLDRLLAVEKPLEGIGRLQFSMRSSDQREISESLDKLLSIEKPFLYNSSPDKTESEKDQLVVVKTEPVSPVIENRSIINEESTKNRKNTEMLEDITSPHTTTVESNTHVSDPQVMASSSFNNTVINSCGINTSGLLKAVKTEPDSLIQWETTSVVKTTESDLASTSDDCEGEYVGSSQVRMENAEYDISPLPKLIEIKKEKEDLSYEQCASQFPGISPDSDSSDDELQQSRDPNLYSASQVKQESEDYDRVLRVKADMICKKRKKRKYDERSESETSLDSPYLHSHMENTQPELETEPSKNDTVTKPIERIFVPQSMLGVHRLQLNDVLNNVKQKHVSSGLDLVDLLNEEATTVPTQKVSWRKNYRKRIADLMAGKEMTMENRGPNRKSPSIQSRRRHAYADLMELQMIQKSKQRTKRSYYGRKIAELTALNKGMLVAQGEKNDHGEEVKSDVKDDIINNDIATNDVKIEKTKPDFYERKVVWTVGKRNSGSLPLKRRNFYEKRIAELRAFEDVDILESETPSVRLAEDALPESLTDSEKDKQTKTDYKKRMADLEHKLKAIREKQKSKKTKSKAKEMCLCPTCSEEFEDQESTVEHIRKVHGNKVVFKCDFCMKMFETKEAKVQHQFMHIEETKSAAYTMLQSDQFKCNICDTSFLFSQSLIQHFRKFHSEDQIDTDS